MDVTSCRLVTVKQVGGKFEGYSKNKDQSEENHKMGKGPQIILMSLIKNTGGKKHFKAMYPLWQH